MVENSMNIIWRPNPGPQTEFLACDAFEALTGGARGGGKSEGLIMDPLRQVHEPEFRGIFFRLTYPDLAQLIERTQRYYKRLFPRAVWNATEKAWTFPSGAKILFRFLKNDDDWIHYQGHEYHWMGFEELTQFTEAQYTNLIPSCRTSNPNIKCYVRATCNPGGRGHNWVKQRFVDPNPSGGVVFRDEITGLTRAFFPSTYRNNPQLLAADPDYVARLKMLPEADRKAMMDGDWDAYIGSIFKLRRGVHDWTWEEFNRKHGLPKGNRKVPAEWKRFRSMDWGFARPFAIYWYAVDYEGIAWCYREWYGVETNSDGTIQSNVGIRLEPDAVAERIAQIEKANGEWDERENKSSVYGVADPSCWSRGTGDHGGGPSIVEQMRRHRINWHPGKNDRISGKMALHDWLYHEIDPATQEVLEYPGMRVIGSECPHAVRTIPALEYDPYNVEDVDTTMEDHAYDSWRYFAMMRPWKPKKKKGTILTRLKQADVKEKQDPWTR